MNRLSFLLRNLVVFTFCFSIYKYADASTSIHSGYFESPLEGRWDLTLHKSGKSLPAWLEVHHSGLHTLIGQYVGPGGSSRPISKVNFDGIKLNFSIPPQWDPSPNDLVFEAQFQGDSLSGTIVESNGDKYTLTGTRAPSLKREMEPVWGKEIKLFDGTDLKGWHVNGANQWKVEDGIMRSPASGSNIMTDQLFNDFKLHIEFRYPKGSNSGVYLRGRYEIQIVDSKGMEPSRDLLGAIYGFLVPTDMMAKDAGEWQSYDVTLIGRLVTLAVNGKTVICSQVIPGITGGALDSSEGEPGPIMIQGDHGAIDFRNILITPAK
ncbi:MAG TPA: DUF1080 domain-containing protein [Puia sp.]|nr:DUF1080 domain-containing protein [Puia sp.]